MKGIYMTPYAPSKVKDYKCNVKNVAIKISDNEIDWKELGDATFELPGSDTSAVPPQSTLSNFMVQIHSIFAAKIKEFQPIF